MKHSPGFKRARRQFTRAKRDERIQKRWAFLRAAVDLRNAGIEEKLRAENQTLKSLLEAKTGGTRREVGRAACAGR